MTTVPVASPPLDEVTTALLYLFRGSTSKDPADWPRRVWDGAFGGNPMAPAYPYGILYPVPGGAADPMPDLDADTSTVTAAWQITSVSNLRNQAQHTARVFRDLLLARVLERADQPYTNTAGWVTDLPMPAGWVCVDRRPDPAMPGVDRVSDPPTAVFTAPFRFTLTIAAP